MTGRALTGVAFAACLILAAGLFPASVCHAETAGDTDTGVVFGPEDRDQALSFLSELFYATVAEYGVDSINATSDLTLGQYLKSAGSDLYLDDYIYYTESTSFMGTPYQLNYKVRALGNNGIQRYSTTENRWVTFATQNIMPINELMQPGTFHERTGGRQVGPFIGTVGTTWHGEFAASQGDIISTIDADGKLNAAKWLMAEIAAACWEGYGPYTYKGRAPNGSDSKYKNSWHSDYYRIKGTFNGDRGPGMGIPDENNPSYGRYHIYEAIYSPSPGEYGFVSIYEDSRYTDSMGKRMPVYGALRFNTEDGSYADNTAVIDNAFYYNPWEYKVLLDCNSREEAMRKNLQWLLTQKKYLYMVPVHAADTFDISAELREDQYQLCFDNCFDNCYVAEKQTCLSACCGSGGCQWWKPWEGVCYAGCVAGIGVYCSGRATYCAGKCAVEGTIIHTVDIDAEVETYSIISINVNGIKGALTRQRSGPTIAHNAVWAHSQVKSNYHQTYEGEDNYFLNEGADNYFLNLVDEGSNTYRFKGVSFDEGDYMTAADYKYYLDFSWDFLGIIDISSVIGLFRNVMVNVPELLWDSLGDAPVLWGIGTAESVNTSPYAPSSPSPPDGTIGSSVNVSLSWQGGDPDFNDTATYDIYLDSSNPPRSVIVPGFISHTSHSATATGLLFRYGTTYYWRIVARDNHGAVTEGPVWSFTTFTAAGDEDNDGLTNGQEIALGTDYSKWDTDGDGFSDWEEVNMGSNPSDKYIIPNYPPVADAGPDRNVITGESVTLDGTASYDPEHAIITFDWRFLQVPEGSTVTDASLSDATSAKPRFTPDIDGAYKLELLANDGDRYSYPNEVEIAAAVFDIAPNANAGSDQNVITGTTVYLDGSGSGDYDTDAENLSYLWSFDSVPDGSFLTDDDITDRDQIYPGFIPYMNGIYKLRLSVSDGESTSEDIVQITAGTSNVPPNAVAGDDIAIPICETALLDGSESNDPGGDPEALFYGWRFISLPSGSAITNEHIHDADTVSPSFAPDVPGTYVIELIVGNAKTFDSDNVAATVYQPAISCPADLTVECAESGGTQSGNPYITHFLTEATDVCGAAPIANNAAGFFETGSTPVTFTSTDESGNTASCTSTVTVEDSTPPSIAEVTSEPNVLWPPNHKMIPVTVSASVSDICDPSPVCWIASVSSNEHVSGPGNDKAPDWEITGDMSLNLRAGRNVKGDGRTYSIEVNCDDFSENLSSWTTEVRVPHDQHMSKK